MEELSGAKQSDIERIEGFGPNTAEAVEQWFSSQKNIEIIKKLHAYGVWPESSVRQSSQIKTLEGLRFVVSGTLTDFTRDGIRDYVKQFGGKVSDSISSKTDYLVLGENPGSKLEKARGMGVKVIGENELKKMAETET